MLHGKEVILDSRLVAAGIIVAVSIVGLYRLLARRSDISVRLGFAEEYLDYLSKYGESGGKNELAYEWMTRHSNKMQNHLGHQGVLATYKPPSANYLMREVPVILNFLPQLHTFINDEWLRGRPVTVEIYATLRDAILRHIGALEELLDQTGHNFRNPLVYFRIGVETILLLPIDMLNTFGFFGNSTKQNAHESIITRIISGIVGLVVFLSGLVTIIVGWDKFFDFMMQTLK